LSANSAPPLAALFGCSGLALSEAERAFFARVNPLGFILFARNIDTPDQVRGLVRSLRDTVGRPDAPVLIDQEGGRVARLRPPHWRAYPPAAAFGRLSAANPAAGVEAAQLNARLIALELIDLGIDVDCVPVLDVPVEDAHDIIGDRAFCNTPARVAELGRAVCVGMLLEGVLPVIKHIPGHGRARVDSHEALPVVNASLAELEATDFLPFRAMADAPWAMTAHVVYTAVDPDAPATTSAKVIAEVIRGTIGFSGVLISDDLGMKALGGGFDERARAALAAGCDVVLHCSGNLAEMEAVAAGAAPLTGAALSRLARATGLRRSHDGIDRAQTLARINELLKAVEA